MAAEGCDVPERRVPGQNGDDGVASAECSERQSTAQRFGQNHDIRHNAEMLKREEPAGAPQPCQDFVENEQRAAL